VAVAERTQQGLVAGLIAVYDLAVDETVRGHVEQTLRSAGVSPVRPSSGEVLDPTRHEVVGIEPTSDPAAAGRIAHVVRPGWTHHDRLLRPAQVVAHPGALRV
jgi:molecular chaperone GrpE